MALSDVTASAVLAAVAEFDREGRDGFLAYHGFHPSRGYLLVHSGRFYDSKAIVGVAHGYATGRPLRASEFSGGAATVAALLRRLGFVVDSPAPGAEAGDLALLSQITTAQAEGRPVPYQWVVLLWAIASARAGHERLTPHADVADELRRVLNPVAVGRSAPDPAMPWAALRDSGWWQVDAPDEAWLGRRPRDVVRDPGVRAGLRADLYARVADEAWTRQAVAVLARLIGDRPGTAAVLRALGLEDLALLAHLPPGSGIARRQPGSGTARVFRVPIEAHLAEGFAAQQGAVTPREYSRAEAALQHAYARHLDNVGHSVSSRRIDTGSAVLVADLFDDTADELIEAKAGTERETLRTALGQVLDYARYVPHTRRSVLLPARPAPEMVDLLHASRVDVVWHTVAGTYVEDRSPLGPTGQAPTPGGGRGR